MSERVEDFFVDSTQSFKVTGLEDGSGNPISLAIVTATITDSDNNVVHTVELDNVTPGLNDFEGTLPSYTLQEGERYTIEFEAQTLSGTENWFVNIRGVTEAFYA